MNHIKLYSIIIGLLLCCGSFAQQRNSIQSAEYYIDQDPGAGNGIAIPVTGFVDSLVNLEITVINTDTLSFGNHKLSVRTQDSLGDWSHYAVSFFQVEDSTSNNVGISRFPIKAAEYYIDQDPGAGNGIAIPVTGFVDSLVTLEITETNPDTLSCGSHK